MVVIEKNARKTQQVGVSLFVSHLIFHWPTPKERELLGKAKN